MSLMILSGAMMLVGIVGGAILIGPIAGAVLAIMGFALIPLYEGIQHAYERKEKIKKMRAFPPHNY